MNKERLTTAIQGVRAQVLEEVKQLRNKARNFDIKAKEFEKGGKEAQAHVHARLAEVYEEAAGDLELEVQLPL